MRSEKRGVARRPRSHTRGDEMHSRVRYLGATRVSEAGGRGGVKEGVKRRKEGKKGVERKRERRE